MAVATLRFYAELNDLLPAGRKRQAGKRGQAYPYAFRGRPSIVDAIEAQGVPHTEVDLILANGASVGLRYHLRDGDRIAVYPVFESLDISSLVRLRAEPLRRTAFVLDGHLGKLARLLRTLGLDVHYQRDIEDAEIIRAAVAEQRIILTRDRGILKQRAVTHGYCVRSTAPIQQAREVVRRFDLYDQVKPLTRCLRCNGIIREASRQAVLDRLPARTAAYYDQFYRCTSCDQVYWPGSHYHRMQATIARILERTPSSVDLSGKESQVVKKRPRKKARRAQEILERRAREQKGRFPLATIAYYGPDDKLATKVAVGILDGPDNLRALERWYSEELDIRLDPEISQEILGFVTKHAVQDVVMTERIIGCPHEEGIDYPQGETCPQCPFWANRDRWTGEVISQSDEKGTPQ